MTTKQREELAREFAKEMRGKMRDNCDPQTEDEWEAHYDNIIRTVEQRAIEETEAERDRLKARVEELEKALRDLHAETDALTMAGGSTLIDGHALKARLDGFVQSIRDTIEIALEESSEITR